MCRCSHVRIGPRRYGGQKGLAEPSIRHPIIGFLFLFLLPTPFPAAQAGFPGAVPPGEVPPRPVLLQEVLLRLQRPGEPQQLGQAQDQGKQDPNFASKKIAFPFPPFSFILTFPLRWRSGVAFAGRPHHWCTSLSFQNRRVTVMPASSSSVVPVA